VPAENARAAKKGVPSKVWPNKAATDACFDACSEMVLEEVLQSLDTGTGEGIMGPSIVYATHNATSIKRSLAQMREKGLVWTEDAHLDVDPRIRGRVSYAQLLGERE
jgi:proline dehydrogenase